MARFGQMIDEISKITCLLLVFTLLETENSMKNFDYQHVIGQVTVQKYMSVKVALKLLKI